MMKNYYEIGKKAILEASKVMLERMEAVGNIIYATPYGSSDIYQIALRRIGENSLADKFIDPNPEIKPRVMRMHDTDSFLAGVITSLQNGKLEFARELERVHREKYYGEGISYMHPHWSEKNITPENRRERLQKGIKERGLKLGQKGPEYINGKLIDQCLQGVVSLPESIFALMGNIALGNNDHSIKLLEEIFQLYWDNESKQFRGDYSAGQLFPYGNWDRTISALRAFNLAKDSRAEELFHSGKTNLMEEFQKYADSSYTQSCQISALAFGLQHFGCVKELEHVKKKMVSKLEIPKINNMDRGKTVFGCGDHNILDNIRLGLGLTGLEQGKSNYYYTS